MLLAQMGVLVIDDVNSMRISIKELLKSFGFKKVTVAPSAEESMQLLELNTFHLILCDWHLPILSGLDFLRYVRKHKEHSKAAFIMVTAESTRERVIEAIQSGVDDYLVKPLTHDQIQEKVYNVLLRRNLL